MTVPVVLTLSCYSEALLGRLSYLLGVPPVVESVLIVIPVVSVQCNGLGPALDVVPRLLLSVPVVLTGGSISTLAGGSGVRLRSVSGSLVMVIGEVVVSVRRTREWAEGCTGVLDAVTSC